MGIITLVAIFGVVISFIAYQIAHSKLNRILRRSDFERDKKESIFGLKLYRGIKIDTMPIFYFKFLLLFSLLKRNTSKI